MRHHDSLPQLPLNRVALVIPAWNEEKAIARVVTAAHKTFPLIIVVNDGSTDRTADEIKKTPAVLVDHPINMGQGAALQTGIEFALKQPEVEYIVTFDADGQHRIEDVLHMLELITTHDVDVVLGSRFLGTDQHMAFLKKMVFKTISILNRITGGLKLTDTNNGLRVFTRQGAEAIDITLPDMAHASEIISIIRHRKLRYMEAPVTIDYHDYGQPLINGVNIVSDLVMRRFHR